MELYMAAEEDMQLLGQRIAPLLTGGATVYLQGELGAGKTTLVRGIARGLGYTGRVTSPSFTIMNVYPSRPEIYHFDFYRLKKDDLFDVGLDDYLAGDGVVLIEWPEIGGDLLPREALIIDISLINDDYDQGRKVTITARDLKYQTMIKEMEKIQCLF